MLYLLAFVAAVLTLLAVPPVVMLFNRYVEWVLRRMG